MLVNVEAFIKEKVDSSTAHVESVVVVVLIMNTTKAMIQKSQLTTKSYTQPVESCEMHHLVGVWGSVYTFFRGLNGAVHRSHYSLLVSPDLFSC